jgi:hypothetical protein
MYLETKYFICCRGCHAARISDSASSVPNADTKDAVTVKTIIKMVDGEIVSGTTNGGFIEIGRSYKLSQRCAGSESGNVVLEVGKFDS